MLRLTIKGVRGHLLRFLLTAAAVTLGVSLVAGTYVLTDSISKTFDSLFDTASTGVDVQVRGTSAGSGTIDGTAVRTPLPLGLVAGLSRVDGVRRAVPDLQGQAILVGKDGTAVRNGGAPSFGFAYYADDPTLHLVAGRGPVGPDQVAVERSTLTRSGLAVGDRTRALVGGSPHEVTVVGEVNFDAGLAGATILVFDPAVARAAFAPDGTVQSFSVTGSAGVSQAELRQRVAAVLPHGAEAITGGQLADENRRQIERVLGFISTFLLVFAAVSLFVGGFIIANTFSMLVAQRTRELALLRALGASRAQVRRVVLGEAAVVGLTGSILGILVGLGLASGLQALFGTFGLQISGGLPLRPRTIVVSLLVGIVVTVLSAVLPAIRAARVAPVVAMRDDVVAPVGGVLRRGIIGGVMIAIGAALVVPAVTAAEVKWLLVALGAALIALGALVAAPTATRPVVRLVAFPFVLLPGVVGRMARENALRNPRRTATTASALMIGLTLMAGISVIADSMKSSVSDLVDSQLTADYVLNGGQAQFPPEVAERAAALPDVASVATLGFVNVQAGGKGVSAIAADSRGLSQNVKLDVQSGQLSALDAGQVAISDKAATARGWRVGSSFQAVVGANQHQPVTVGAVFRSSQVLNDPSMIIPRVMYKKDIPQALQGDYLVYVKARPGADRAAVRQALVQEVKPFVVVSVQDGSEFTDSQASQINQLLYILYALLALSVLIAVLGIVNTLALSVFERTREIGLLRAVGLSRGQLRRMITIESVTTAVFGALLGAALGLVFGVVVQHGLAKQGLEVLSIPYAQIVYVIVLAGLAGVVAAVLPAWRAVRLDVLRAITTE